MKKNNGFDSNGNSGRLESFDVAFSAAYWKINEDFETEFFESEILKNWIISEDDFEEFSNAESSEIFVPYNFAPDFDLIKLQWGN